MDIKTRLFHYIKPQKKNILFASISVIIFLISQLLLPYLVGKSINAFGEMDGTQFIVDIDLNTIVINLTIAAALCFIGAFFDFIFEYLVNIMSQNIVKAIRDDVYHKLNNAPIKTIDNMQSGDLVQLEIGDIENIAIFTII